MSRKILFAILVASCIGGGFAAAGGISNSEHTISKMTKIIVAAIVAQQKLFEKGVDNYQKKLIEKQLVILGRIKQISGVKILVTRSYFENQSTLHNLVGTTRLLDLQTSLMKTSR